MVTTIHCNVFVLAKSFFVFNGKLIFA